MLLKEFSHILNNTKLITKELVVPSSSSKNKLIYVEDIVCSAEDEYTVLSVSTLVKNNTIDIGDLPSDYNDGESTSSYSHYMLSFDQTQLQTQIMSKYVQILCNKYGVNEDDVEFDVSPFYKDEKLWLLYSFKFPTLKSNDSISISDFQNYINQNDEYNIIGTITSGIGSPIRIYISNSNEITSAPEMYAAIRSNAYTLLDKEYHDGDSFHIAVKYGCSVLFRAEYCHDLILTGVQQNIGVNINLSYDDSLQNSRNKVTIETENILSNSTTYVYSNPENLADKYTYEQEQPKTLELIINSLDKETYKMLGNDTLSFAILEATHFEEDLSESTQKNWSIVSIFNASEIIKKDTIYVVNRNNISTLLKSIPIKQSIFNKYIQSKIGGRNINNYVSSYYIKPALINTNTHEIINSINNIVSVDCVWKDEEGIDITSLEGSGNRLLIQIDYTPEEGYSRITNIPTELENAYIYNVANDIGEIPNIILPTTTTSPHYLTSTYWKACNGYIDNDFSVRTTYCNNNNIHTSGRMASQISFVIDYISYYIDSERPSYFFKQYINLPNDIEAFNETYSTGNDVYDIKRTRLYIKNINISNLTLLKLTSYINRVYYKYDNNGKLIIKNDNGEYVDDGIINNYSEDYQTMKKGSIEFNNDDEFEIKIIPELLSSDYKMIFEDENNNIIAPKKTQSNLVYYNYDSVSADSLYFIKKYFSNNTLALQNVLPDDIDHIGVYSTYGASTTKIGQLSISDNIKNTENTEPLLKIGFLSDIHFDRSTSPGNIKYPESEEDMDNALRYFYQNKIYDIYSAGDLSLKDGYEYTTDLGYFKEAVTNILGSINSNKNYDEDPMRLFISRGNHDCGCLYSKNPINPVNEDDNNPTNVYDLNDDESLYDFDCEWKIYAHPNINWDYGYYFPNNIDENNDISEDESDIDSVGINSSAASSYNVYYLGKKDGFSKNDPNTFDLKLIVIALPLYSGYFWTWSGSNRTPAYANKEIYNLELLLRKFYAKPKTEIIVITHLPFHNGTGNYKDLYHIDAMMGWYNQSQYEMLEELHDAYKGVIWVEGHTHIKYEMQGNKTTMRDYEGYFDNANISCISDVFDVHISSCAYPRIEDSNKTSVKDLKQASQGSYFEIYKDHILIKCVNFKENSNTLYTNGLVPVGIYKINFLTTKPEVNQVLQYVWRRTLEDESKEYNILEFYTDGGNPDDPNSDPIDDGGDDTGDDTGDNTGDNTGND